jgi:hypothetical protein
VYLHTVHCIQYDSSREAEDQEPGQRKGKEDDKGMKMKGKMITENSINLRTDRQDLHPCIQSWTGQRGAIIKIFKIRQ